MLLGAVLSTILLLLRFSKVQLTQDEAVVCESDGHCVLTGSKTLYQDDLCEIPPKFPSLKITPNYEPLLSRKPARDVELSRGGGCSDGRDNSNNVSDIVLESIEISYTSVSVQYLSLCVSWELASSSGQHGGLQVDYGERHIANGRVIELSRLRYCVSNPTRRKLCLNNIKYGMLLGKYHTIEVFPYPHSSDDDLDRAKKTDIVQNTIAGCADIPQVNGTACGLKEYNEPRNIILESCTRENGSMKEKDLKLSWDPPAGAEVPPQSYIAIISDEDKLFRHFNITNSYWLILRGMNASKTYTVEMKAYRQCSGLGSAMLSDLGYGKVSGVVRETSRNCTTTFELDTDTTSVNYNTSSETASPLTANNEYYLPVLLGTIGTVVLAGLILTVFGFILLKHFQHSSINKTAIYPKPLENPKVFVFYSPSMCDSRLKSLQERIVCLLLEYFEVVTPDDISSGNISMWLEDTVKSVHSILLVANKEFCCDWNKSKDDRSPVMNSLELLISSAAAQNSIGKFGFVSSEDGLQDVFVPDHSYLKLMPVFLLGQKTCDIDKLYQFVTKSRGIELGTDS